MHLYKIFKLLVALVFLSSCASLQTREQQQNYRNMVRDLRSLIVTVQENMISSGNVGALVLYSKDAELFPVYYGDSPLSVAISQTDVLQFASDNLTCIFLPRYDIPAQPIANPCASLQADAKIILRLTAKISHNSNKIEDNRKLIEKNTELFKKNADATLEAFRLAATNANLIIAQSDLIDGLKTSTTNLNSKIQTLDAKFQGFSTSINSQLSQLLGAIQSLNVRLDRL